MATIRGKRISAPSAATARAGDFLSKTLFAAVVAVFIATSSLSLGSTPTNLEASRESAATHAQEHNRYAIGLANRGAVFSARVEFTRALTIIAHEQDVLQGSGSRSKALVEALTAMDEADSFAEVLNSLTVKSDLSALIVSHRTPVLKERVREPIRVLEALQAYFDYAERQFIYAAGGKAVASESLHGLARVQSLLPKMGNSQELTAAKSMVLNRAALRVDPTNVGAGNELAVALARYGHLDQAEAVLRQTLVHHERPECWHNLAKIYEKQGRTDLARQAQTRSDTLRAAVESELGDQAHAADQMVRWVDMSTFLEAGSSAEPQLQAAPAVPDPINAADASDAQRERHGIATRWLRGFLPGKDETRPPLQNPTAPTAADKETNSRPRVARSLDSAWSATK